MRRLELSDGSTVELNTNSAIVTTFTRAERRVRLEKGEAYFEVAKDEQRPFLVEAAGVGVRAIGTAFNVRLRSESVEVLVTEGKVRVRAERAADGAQPSPAHPAANEDTAATASGDTIVGAGERVVVALAAGAGSEPRRRDVVPVQADEVQRLLAWQGRRLDFSDTPLAEMAAEFNRYNRHQLVIVDENLAAMRFGGSFRPDDRAGFVRMLQEHFGVRAEERKNQTILRGAR
jgi:transmembrane sensor